MNSTHRLLAKVALTGFVLSAITHVLALAGVDVSDRFPFVWVLHVGVFVVAIPFVISSRKRLGMRPSLSDIRTLVPNRIFVAGVVVFIYAIVNFVLFFAATREGSPAMEAGKTILQNHGHLIREISQAEYVALRAEEVRGFSGHWLFFYFVSFAYFMFAKTSTLPAQSASTGKP